jgi:hypothetical protein
MQDIPLLFEQYLFISTLLSLFIIFYHLPSITSYFNERPLDTHNGFKLAAKIVIKRLSHVPNIKIVIFSFQRLKIKYSSSKDLEDCCPLL